MELMGHPQIHHLHFKLQPPSSIQDGQVYSIILIASSEMDLTLLRGRVRLSLTIWPPAASIDVQVANESKPVMLNGKARFDIRFVSKYATRSSSRSVFAICKPFYLHINAQTDAHILPALSNPITMIDNRKSFRSSIRLSMSPMSMTESRLDRHPLHALPVRDMNEQVVNIVIFREILGSGLGLRCWDCGSFLIHYIRSYVHFERTFAGRRVLELGSGTGLVGLWLLATLAAHKLTDSETLVTLTDQPEALENLQHNVQGNIERLAADNLKLMTCTVQPLLWGDEEHLTALSHTKQDVIIASDVVFNPAYFEPLLHTIDVLSDTETRLILVYRARGTDCMQDKPFFDVLVERHWSITVTRRYEDVLVLMCIRETCAELSGICDPQPVQNDQTPQMLLLPFQT